MQQPASLNFGKVNITPTGVKCCISQDSSSLIIRLCAGKVKPIHIFVEAHCSLPVSINFFRVFLKWTRAGSKELAEIGNVTLVVSVIVALNGSSHICDWGTQQL